MTTTARALRRVGAAICMLSLTLHACGMPIGGGEQATAAKVSSHYHRPQSPAPVGTLVPGSRLPDDATCAGRVVASDEVREANAAANQVVPAVVDVDIDGASDQYNPENRGRITGDFSGTTDEILQWGACKWGFHVDLVRARAVIESYWRQSTTGDLTDDPEICARIGMDAPCHESYGLMQVRGTVHEDTFPLSRDSTSFNVDYSLAWLRACYEGAFPWLGPDYVAGDDIGCAGAWFSGRWYDASAVRYIDDLVAFRDAAIWETAEFDRADG